MNLLFALLERYEGRLALVLALLYAVVFGSLALIRHWAFHSMALDLSVFDQVLWNTVHGRFMESTLSLERCDPHSFFLDHFSPALLLIVPFYLVVPRPETLIAFQTVALLPLGLAMYFLAARRTLPLLLSLGASFLVKEELPLIAIGFGLALLVQRRWRLGAFVAIASAAWFV